MDTQTQKISLDELQRKIENPKTTKSDLAQYFEIDKSIARPFSSRLTLNPATVNIPTDPTALGWGNIFGRLFNKSERERRIREFQERINSGYTGPVIVSEGDSWFMWYAAVDIIDTLRLYGFAVRSLEAAGDTLEDMVKENEYIQAIQTTNASIFLLSGGGNDALGGGALKEHLRDFDQSLSPSDHLLPSFYDLLSHTMGLYEQILQSVKAVSGDIVIICHGYDYCIPNNDIWLGNPMKERRITDRNFQAAIVRTMIDEFNERLRVLTFINNARYLDLRGTVGGVERWFNEIHPGWTAFGELGDKFKAEIDKATSPRA
jgi:hypothetical protein